MEHMCLVHYAEKKKQGNSRDCCITEGKNVLTKREKLYKSEKKRSKKGLFFYFTRKLEV